MRMASRFAAILCTLAVTLTLSGFRTAPDSHHTSRDMVQVHQVHQASADTPWVAFRGYTTRAAAVVGMGACKEWLRQQGRPPSAYQYAVEPLLGGFAVLYRLIF